jgi:hypothetical protein
MVAPLVVGAGLGALAIGSYLQKKAGDDLANATTRASKDQVEQLKAIIAKIEAGWQNPDLNTSPITPQEIQLLERYTPQVAQFTKENAPQLITGAGGEQARSAQRDALAQLQARASGAPDEQAQAEMALGQEQAAAQARGNRADILRSLAQRGLSGSGTDIAAQMQAAGQSEQMARQSALQVQSQAAQRRAEALREMTGLASTMRGQATQQEQSNVDVMNSFNQRAAMRKQTYDQYVAQTKNEAALRNMTEAQRTQELNARQQYAAAVDNRNRQNAAVTQKAQGENDRLNAIAGMERGVTDKQYVGSTQAAGAKAAGQSALGSGAAKLGATAIGYGATPSQNAPTDTTQAGKDADLDEYSFEKTRSSRGGMS